MSDHATLRDAIIYFSDFDHCKQFMMDLRWFDGQVKCPNCGGTRVVWIPSQKVWKCYEKHPQRTFSLKTGTIFEDSPIALDKWLPATWMLVNCKNGISSWELHRALGVTQKTAWFMLQRIRLASQDQTHNKLAGEVEVDETFIGGKARFMHADKRAEKITGRGPEGKAIVFGLLDRETRKVRATVVGTRRKGELQKHVRENVAAGSELNTDALKSYEGLDEYQHKVIDHAETYVDGTIHTNGLENFWSLLKRAIKGTYVSVEPFHLFRYLDEQTFRYNERKATDCERFAMVFGSIAGKRLTWDILTAQEAG